MSIFRALFAFLTFLSLSLHAADWDGEFWQTLNCTQATLNPFKVYATAELRFNHQMRTAYVYRMTENLAYTGIENIDFEAHFSYIFDKNRGARHFKNRSRLELEANPFYNFCNGIKMRLRNRLELIKVQNTYPIHIIFRQQFRSFFPIEGQGALRGITFLNEVFYNATIKKWTQNRLTPIQLNFEFCRDQKINLSLMIRNFYSALKWYRSLAFCSKVIF